MFGRLFVGGTEGNRRLTAATAAVLLVLLAAEGATLLAMDSLLSVHMFLGMLLIPPVALKLASTGYRFARYYLRDEALPARRTTGAVHAHARRAFRGRIHTRPLCQRCRVAHRRARQRHGARDPHGQLQGLVLRDVCTRARIRASPSAARWCRPQRRGVRGLRELRFGGLSYAAALVAERNARDCNVAARAPLAAPKPPRGERFAPACTCPARGRPSTLE